MKKKNFLFIYLFLFLIFIVALFNYAVDPYAIFRPDIYKNLANYKSPRFIPRILAKTNIKAYKDFKFDYFTIGSSDNKIMFGVPEISGDIIYNVTIPNITAADRYLILKYYLDLHPETKVVFLPIAYDSCLPAAHESRYKFFNGGNIYGYSIQELLYLLLSFDTTKESFDYLNFNYFSKFFALFTKSENYNINNFKNNFKRIFETQNFRLHKEFYNEDRPCYPQKLQTRRFNDKEIEYKLYDELFYISETIHMIKSRNIECIVFIPPYHALQTSIFYSNPKYHEIINDFKKFLVRNSGVVYDFQYISKFTTTDLYNNNRFYLDLKHLTPLYGLKIFRYFFDEAKKEDELCLVLTKDNINDMLKLEDELFEEYKKTHQKEINEYIELYNNLDKKQEPLLKFILKDIPSNYDPDWD